MKRRRGLHSTEEKRISSAVRCHVILEPLRWVPYVPQQLEEPNEVRFPRAIGADQHIEPRRQPKTVQRLNRLVAAERDLIEFF